MSRLRGDLEQIRRFSERVHALSYYSFRAGLADLVGAALMKQLADQFRGSYDPYGNEWAPLKYRKGQPLRDTGRMEASANSQTVAGHVSINIPVEYATYHQYGTRARRVAERGARQNARGRFVKDTAKTGFLLRIKAHTNTGIPQRQMLPMEETGGLGPIWTGIIEQTTARWILKNLGKG